VTSSPPASRRQLLRRGEVLKQVARCRLREDGSIEAEVRIEALPADHPLAGCAQRGKPIPGHRPQGCEARRSTARGPAAGRPQPRCSPT
jgi:homoserine dehydrogenase